MRRPVAGSKTEQRGRKAHAHICREILELCEIIDDMGRYHSKYRDDDEDELVERIPIERDDDSPIIVKFGDLFQVSIPLPPPPICDLKCWCRQRGRGVLDVFPVIDHEFSEIVIKSSNMGFLLFCNAWDFILLYFKPSSIHDRKNLI